MAKPNLLFNPKWQIFDNSGAPLNGGKLFFYNTGTTTKCNTYTDSTLNTANPNPIILDSAGRPSNSGVPIDIYVNQAVKVVCAPSTDTDPPTNALWTEDNITTLGQTISSFTKTTTYTVTQSDRDKLIKADVSGGGFTINLPSASSCGDGFTIRIIKIDSSGNTLTITPNGTDNINGSNSSQTTTSQYATFFLYCDGTQWFKL